MSTHSDLFGGPLTHSDKDGIPVIATGVSGILPEQFIRAFLRDGVILAASAFEPAQVQPASLDLRLGSVAYRVRASFLPGIEARVLDRLHYMDAYKIDIPVQPVQVH